MSEREALVAHARAARTSLAWLSRALGRDERYLSRFAAGGPPANLPAADRHWLALFFGDTDAAIGIPAGDGRA